MTKPAPQILCFGEILWDFLPDGLFPGGAPFNVAYHLKQQGADAKLISAVGRDLLGDELLRRVKSWDISTETIALHQGLPTGYVQAEIGSDGDATYDIVSSVAWDQIMTGQDSLQAAMNAQAIVFGSLAQRSAFNQSALDRLLATVPADAWRIFDVNLRPPYDDLELVRQLAQKSTLLKLNAAEAARLVDGGDEQAGREEKDARALAESTSCARVCITSGSRGAGLLHGGQWSWEPGREISVVDTIGAGDSFLATLATHLIQGQLTDAECLARACRIGEWVATQRGATPTYNSSTPR
jgi:fructokinase|uniref:PfkB family carbohydrate kinase n=1 Tax=Cephaloticoccus sp. TaxID=1985742 RepID=UPI0040499C07